MLASITLENLIHALLVSSDPVIFSLRCSLKKEPTYSNEEAVQLLHKDEIDYEILSNFFNVKKSNKNFT
jgi:hypothetical protein